MNQVNKLEDVFTPGMLLVMQGIRDSSVFHGHRDGEHGRDYILMLRRDDAGKIAEVRVALVDVKSRDTKAKLILRFDSPGKFFFEYSCEENALSAAELAMEREGRLDHYMVERLVATGMLLPSFAGQLRTDAPIGAA